MAFIAHKEKNFRKYIENHFGMVIPKDVVFFYADGVRIASPKVLQSDIRGDNGYAACDAGFNPTNSFIQNFGYLATKNAIELDEKQAKEFAVGRGIGNAGLGGKSRFIVIRHKEFTVGLGYYDSEEKKIKNRIPEKRRRRIINCI